MSIINVPGTESTVEHKALLQDLIGKNLIAVMSDGNLREGKVIRLSPNRQAVQYQSPHNPKDQRQVLYWEVIYLQMDDPKPTPTEGNGSISQIEMGQEAIEFYSEINEIKRIDIEINRLEIVAENVYNQIKTLKERKKFYEMLPN